jgi:hypothetical protein
LQRVRASEQVAVRVRAEDALLGRGKTVAQLERAEDALAFRKTL